MSNSESVCWIRVDGFKFSIFFNKELLSESEFLFGTVGKVVAGDMLEETLVSITLRAGLLEAESD